MQTNNLVSMPHALPNGHELLNMYYNPHTKRGVVLGRSRSAVQPYATWIFYRNDLHSTSYGHYFKSHKDASDDFMQRVAEEG